MKILWVCNIMLPMVAKHLNKEASNKEGWITGLADTILKNRADNQIELAVAFPTEEELCSGSLKVPVEYGTDGASPCDKEKAGFLTCYGFKEDVAHPECYSQDLEVRIREIIADFKPDVVHCFGTEFPHTLAVTRVCPKEKILIGIQGICKLCQEVYLADLPERVVNRVTFRDWLKKDSIRKQLEKYEARSRHEREALKNAGHVTGRTRMDQEYTQECNSKAMYHPMNETLRSNFYEGQWSMEACEKHSIFLSQGDYPLKGLHYVLKALPEIIKEYPDVKLYVAGNPIVRPKNPVGSMKISSYGKYIMELLEQYGLEEKVIFLGKMSAQAMKEQFLKSNVFICSSAIENSPNSLGEAMLLGVPCVAANVGGIPSVFEHGRDGITYPGYGASEYARKEDKEQAQAMNLARAVIEMWSDEERMQAYGRAASAHAKKTHDGQANYNRLVEIYKEIAGN